MSRYFLGSAILVLLLSACSSTQRGSTMMRWAEKPRYEKPMAHVSEEKRLHFEKVGSYTEGKKGFQKIKRKLREGDVIAYKMTRNEARKDVLRGNINSVGYRVLDYGHLAILTQVKGKPGLHLLSSQSFKGPNTDEDINTLKDHSFDVYRLNRWNQVDLARFHEFVEKSKAKAGNWIGYDFSGMFGFWNSNLRPDKAEAIGYDYICSTIVAAALYYAGADMQVSRRNGYLDLVSPRQVISSHGVLRDIRKN